MPPLLQDELNARQRTAIRAVCTEIHPPYVYAVAAVLTDAEHAHRRTSSDVQQPRTRWAEACQFACVLAAKLECCREEPQCTVAVVTGANRGLGYETARQLLAKGLVVVLAGRDAAALERARQALRAEDQRRAVTVQLDVTSVETITAPQRPLVEQVGSVDVLVNNAALLLGERDGVLSIPIDDYRRAIETNLLGVIEVCRT